MISRLFDLAEFFDAITKMNYFEAIVAARKEVQSADSLSSKVKGSVKARSQGSGHYSDVLKKYLFFLQSGTKPYGIEDEDFALFYPSCKRFTEEGPLLPKILTVFESFENLEQ